MGVGKWLPWSSSGRGGSNASRAAEEELNEQLEHADEIYELYLEYFEEYILPIAVAIVTADVTAALGAGKVNIPAIATLQNLYKDVDESLAGPKAAYQREQERIQGILDSEAVSRSVSLIRSTHRLGVAFVPIYRERVAAFYGETRKLSRSVFGDTQTLQSGLNLVQMVTYDVTNLEGEPVDISQTTYFATAVQVTDSVEQRSAEYARNPGKFWFDLNEKYILPLERRRAGVRAANASRLETMGLDIESAALTARGASSRLLAYRHELDPFLGDGKLAELDEIRRNFNRDVTRPLERLSDQWEQGFPPVKELAEANEQAVRDLEERTDEVEVIVDDPARLDRVELEQQRDRFSDITTQALKPIQTGPEDMQRVISRLDELTARIRER